MNNFYVYIMASKRKGVLYIGITNDLIRRVYEHKQGIVKGFTKKYKIDKLVYFEVFSDPEYAIRREKQLKNWHRQWKLNLIERTNPNWNDLYEDRIPEQNQE
jgi:putative endonuclease